MEPMGYGVLVQGKPSGLWPRSWASAMWKALKERAICSDVQVVPIYIGKPLEIVTPPSK